MQEHLFDSHAHYFDTQFVADGEDVNAFVSRLFDQGLAGIVNVGTDLTNANYAVAQAAKFPHMYAAVGIHPTDSAQYVDVDATLTELERFLDTPESRAQRKIVALGEIGLDYHYPDTDKATQAGFFEGQLALADRLSMPVIIHDRDAHGDCFDTVRRYPMMRGVFHSFSGSAEMARELVRRGWYVSFSGVVTFKNAPRVREAVAAVPLERLLIETDAPYLAPHPHRGERNHSGFLRFTAAAIAAVKETSADAIIRATRENACRLFGISQ